MQKQILASLVFANLLLAQEPSAFNAGGDTPPKTEKQILNERLFNLSSKVKSIEESQEGLKSVFEGQLQRIQEISRQLSTSISDNNATITSIKEHVDTNFATQNENIQKLQASIAALGELIQKVDTQTKAEIDTIKKLLLEESQEGKTSAPKQTKKADSSTNAKTETPKAAKKDVGQAKVESGKVESVNIESAESPKTEPAPKKVKSAGAQSVSAESGGAQPTSVESSKAESPKAESLSVENLKNKPLAEVFTEGEKLLEQKQYELASEYLQKAVEGHYKPARGNYLLGEAAFYQGKYEEAIYYYKVSAGRYDKADYMPLLMLHTAQAFEKLNNKENSKKFLESLVALYPDSKESQEAKKLLSK